MDKCFTPKLNVQASGYFLFIRESKFNNIKTYVKIYYSRLKDIWEGTIYNWIKVEYEKLKQHGGCPVIMNEKDLALLNLNYEVEDFCEEKETRMNEISCLKKGHTDEGKCNSECALKIKEYNSWINSKKDYFNNKKEPIISKCNIQPSHFPTKKCNILGSNIFSMLTECRYNNLNALASHTSKEDETPLPNVRHNTDYNLPDHNVKAEEVDESSLRGEIQTEHGVQNASQSNFQDLLSNGSSGTQSDTIKIQNIETKQYEDSHISPEPETNEQLPPAHKIVHTPGAHVSLGPHSTETNLLTSEASVPSSSSDNNNHPKILGMFKKKKKIRRRHVKFIRLRVPSFFNNKSNLLTDDQLAPSIYDDEEIIKYFRINELKKNVNLSKRKINKSKTIIEIHMEVVEKCINEKWQSNKEEFLQICLDEFSKREYRTYPYLTKDDQISENIKCTYDIKKSSILWNKWMEKHRNISNKLKKEDWFNNLKNEWKREIAYIQEMEKFNKKLSSENHKVPFLEKEKDLWKQWISKQSYVIEQYMEQDSLKLLAMDLNNISDEWVNKGTKNYISLINIEEFQNKENYEEIYKYIKKKLLTNICILVLTTIFEEFKKEMNFEKRESYLDSNLNEWKKEVYSDTKQKITENIEYNRNDLKNTRNKEVYTNIGNDSLRNEIEDWISEDNANVNFTVNDEKLNKTVEISGTHIL
ncbi:hypothetical protein MKS88_000601 [Plasmodium brasilianum]|uniref:Uncharacterized protein n=1 Tax=Plasmodium brasilianum TaxID=5824 RepID=A0ACB9YFN2_PLABR|nr:hypothetical protein MKS88_000601 [Plasmodium brasilianum]